MITKAELFKIHPEKFMLKCGICGKYFLPISYTQYKNLTIKAKNYNRLFYCSNECKKLKFGTKKCICNFCGKEFEKNQYNIKHRKLHFCSKVCFNEYLKETKKSNKAKETVCLNCGKNYFIQQASRGKFCSIKCSAQYRLKQSEQKILNGICVSERILKNYLLRHYSKCMNPECKWDWTDNNNPILELQHKDGNHLNNTLENCLLLCPNCHSLTDNYKFKRGHKSTRKYRKKYTSYSSVAQ